MTYAILTVRNNRNVWMPLPSTQLAPRKPVEPDYWWRSAYTSLRRNMNNDDLVDRFDAICGEVIDPRRDVIQPAPELKLAA